MDMLILANYLFPGVIEGQAFLHVTHTLLGMPLNCLFLVPSPINEQGTDLEC